MVRRWRSKGGISRHLIFILGVVSVIVTTAAANDHISINCGSSAPFRDSNGRQWLGDFRSKFLTIEGMSTTVRCKNDLDLVTYSTARISRSQFSYRFRMNPGEKFIRLHFSKGLEYMTDLFSVEAGPFTLLNNFSPSITARALALDAIVKEYCLTVEENQPLDIVFTATQAPLLEVYAFVNGIEILSVSSDLSYCHGDSTGVQIVGDKDVVGIDRCTALEIVRRVDLKSEPLPNNIGDVGSIFRVWEKRSKQKEGFLVEKSMSWKTSVDVGFKYLVRIHFCEIGLKIARRKGKDFSVVIDGVIVATIADVMPLMEEEDFLWHKNHMVVVRGRKRQDKPEIIILLYSEEGFVDANGLFEGFEILKISNLENSLAGPNPSLPLDSRPLNSFHAQFLFIASRNSVTNVFVIGICVVLIIHLLRRILDVRLKEVGENEPSARAKSRIRLFSLDEIKSATDDFHDRFLIGKGGFGNVYKGTIDNGMETVAIKRLKESSTQGKREFLTEIEALSEMRHCNLVCIIGYCMEQHEMILVYEYVSSGSLADHLYKFATKNKASSTLSWTQRLGICIGAAKGLDYVHTGHGVIHRDIKTSNILLDENLVAKVSDFGLATWESGKVLQSRVSEHVKGTRGYVDPYFIKTLELTSKSDTYAFGVVLLEVLCGRPALEPFAAEEKRILTIWAQSKIQNGEVDSIVDPSIKTELLSASLRTFVGITEKCLQDTPMKRPTIDDVIINLRVALEQQEHGKSVVPNGITRITNFLPPPSVYHSLPSATTPMTEQFKSGVSVDGNTAVHKLASFIPFTAVWKSRKLSKGKDKVLQSAPISRRTGKVAFTGANVLDNTIPGNLDLDLTPGVRVFTFSELKTATENFSTLLGEGGFGSVHKGWLQENPRGRISSRYPIAVKRLRSDSMQGYREWLSEVRVLSKISHPNLVKLLGYCCEKNELLLVYELIEMGSLDKHLYRTNSTAPSLPWYTRLTILTGVARGLAHLHSMKMIFRDVKPSNILLDKMFNPRITDFGLARSGPTGDESHVSTRVVGTYGYADPEYMGTGFLRPTSDVYGFGVVMLEMLTGLRAVDNSRPHRLRYLVQWTKPLLGRKKKLKNIMDSSLQGKYTPKAAHQAACLAQRCLSVRRADRPSALELVARLEEIRSNSDRELFEYITT